MARYEVKGPNGEVIGTASELKVAKDMASFASKKTKAKFIVVDTSSQGVKEKNTKVLNQLRNLRGGGAGLGGMFGVKNR